MVWCYCHDNQRSLSVINAGISFLVKSIEDVAPCWDESTPSDRVNCGWSGISETECRDEGCCFDSSVPNVPWCFHRPDASECYHAANGSDYRGTVSMTVNGNTCQEWTEQTPHSHEYTPENYPNAGLGEHNYCRNPGGENSAWCYTTNSSVRWELCGIGQPEENCITTTPPVATPITTHCEDPVELESGGTVNIIAPLNTVVRFACADGYQLVGPDRLTCSGGKWNPPKCEAVCPLPTEPEHGSITVETSGPIFNGTKITFHCNEGYDINGSAEITCGNGGWLDEYPDCVDFDECLATLDNCSAAIGHEMCINTMGGFRCDCADGYTRESRVCAPLPVQQPQRCGVLDETGPHCSAVFDDQGSLLWPATNANCSTEWITCFTGQVGSMKRHCDVDGKWREPDTTGCISEKMLELASQIENITDASMADDVLVCFGNLTSAGHTVVAGDLLVAGELIGKIVAKKPLELPGEHELKMVTVQHMFDVASGVLHKDKIQVWENIYENLGPTGGAESTLLPLHKFKDDISKFMVATSLDSISVNTESIDFEAHNKPLPARESVLKYPDVKHNLTVRLPRSVESFDGNYSYVVVPLDELVTDKANSTVVVTTSIYHTLPEILPPTFIGERRNVRHWVSTITAVQRERKVNSDVLSVSINSADNWKLKRPISIKYYHIQRATLPVCGYIVYGHRDGIWSKEGCWEKETDIEEGYTICNCAHPGDFGVVMEIYQDVEPFLEAARDVIIQIGQGVAMFLYACTLVILFLSRLQNDKYFILKNLTIAMLCSDATMFTAQQKTKGTNDCKTVAAAVFTSSLSSFSWLLIESVQLVLRVKYSQYRSYRARAVYLTLGWLLPALIGLLCVYVANDDFMNANSCWMTDDNLAINVAPHGSIFIMNVLMMAFLRRMLITNNALIGDACAGFRGDIEANMTILLVLTTTWFIGILSVVVNDNGLLGYAFAFLTLCKGSSVFLIYAASNQEVLINARLQVLSRFGWRNCDAKKELDLMKVIGIESSKGQKEKDVWVNRSPGASTSKEGASRHYKVEDWKTDDIKDDVDDVDESSV
ncbi:cadherin EGF LAG seven-pass G-type receptor 2-like [Ptychodera flava]|uniref:cadherin EGF LAG seven-pass G-type receptor 2-like n=1 Tax=Ptychodera flava TaxID=63121 RepID=UPI00396A021B